MVCRKNGGCGRVADCAAEPVNGITFNECRTFGPFKVVNLACLPAREEVKPCLKCRSFQFYR